MSIKLARPLLYILSLILSVKIDKYDQSGFRCLLQQRFLLQKQVPRIN